MELFGMMGNVKERREVKMALKEYKKRNDKESRSRYCSCKQKYVKLVDEKKHRRQEKKPEHIYYMMKQKDVRKISVTVKNILVYCLQKKTKYYY
jgi:hypothetical protein